MKNNPNKGGFLPEDGVLALAALVFFLFNTISRYPGIGNPDSKNQYMQAVSGHYTDWHPPVMAWLWSYLRFFGDGDGTLFVLHMLCYWAGFGLIAISLRRSGRRGAAWLVLALGLFPPFLMMNVQILKDVGLAVAFLMSFALLFTYRLQDKKVNPAVGVFAALFLAYGILVRANGIFAAAPLLIYLFYPKLLLKPARLLVACLVIVIVTIPLFNIVNSRVFHATPTYPIRSLEIYDIAGIARFSGDMSVFGAGNSFTSRQVRDCYTPLQWDTMTGLGKCHVFWDRLAVPPGYVSAHKADGGGGSDPLNPNLMRLWLSAIEMHPLAYLEHRIDHFNSELYLIVPRHHADFRVLFRIVYGKPIDRSEFKPLKWKIMDYLRYNPFSTPAFALVLGFIVLALTWPRRAAKSSPLRTSAFCLSVSGLLYTLAYAVIGIASDTRYQFWSMLTAYIGFIICASEQRRHFFPPDRTGWICAAILTVTAAVILAANITLGDPLLAGQ